MTDYPEEDTRVRWRSHGGGKWATKEGVVILMSRAEAMRMPRRLCRFNPVEAFRGQGFGRSKVVVTDDGKLYHPRPEWLERVEEPADD